MIRMLLPLMAGPKAAVTFSSLQKYTRERQLYAKNGFFLTITSTGEVTGTSDESCLYGEQKNIAVLHNYYRYL